MCTWDISVRKVTALRLEDQGLICDKVRNCIFTTRLRLALVSTKPLGKGCFLGLMWPEFEAGQSLPSVAEFEIVYTFTFTPLLHHYIKVLERISLLRIHLCQGFYFSSFPGFLYEIKLNACFYVCVKGKE